MQYIAKKQTTKCQVSTTSFYETIIQKNQVLASLYSMVTYPRKLISDFFKDHPKKPIATSSLQDSTPLIPKLTVLKE